MSAVKQRRSLTIEEKRNIILNLESGCSNTFISQQYNLSHSTVSNIFKQRNEIKQMFEQSAFTKKKIRYSMHRDIENALLEWFKCHKDTNLSINIPMLQAKADEFGKLLGKPDFKCSSSWVQRFKRRHYNEFAKVISGRSQACVPQGIKKTRDKIECTNTDFDWLQNVWPVLREGYSDEEIYNAFETGLFYKIMPEDLFKCYGQKCAEGELSKERLTVLITANMTGTDKKKLLVIGKFKNPRSFKNIKALPVQYEYNPKSWMTSLIFKKFLQQWDLELFQNFKKAIVLLDDCMVHSQFDELRSIKVVFFPSNNITLIQSMNQGIVKSFKLHYRKQLILHHLKQIENNQYAKINIFHAICMLESAWEQILPQTIVNSFCNAKLKEVGEKFIDEESGEESLSSWAANLLVYDVETLQKFENLDFELATSSQTSNIEHFDHDEDEKETILEETDDEKEIETEKEKVTLVQAFEALNKLKQFLTTNEHFSKSYNHTKQLQILLEKSLYKQKKSQTKITNYFKKLK